MLPPIDSSVLTNNPRFEKLYNTITTSILNPDGSTKIDPSAKQRDAVRQELQAYRLKAARVHLLRNAISTAASSQTTPTTPTTAAQPNNQEPDQAQQKQQQSRYQQRRPKPTRQLSQPHPHQQPEHQNLPPDLIQLLLLLPAFLNNASTLSAASTSLLLTSPPFTSLPTLFPQILALLSTVLSTNAKTLARVLSPSTNPSYIHRAIPSLPSISSALVSELSSSKTALSRARLAATASITQYQARHTEAVRLLIAALETKHGDPAVSSRALHASHAASAWAIAAECLLWKTRHKTYPPAARAALLHYRQHLQDAGRRLEDGSRVREAELADYGVDVDNRRRDSVSLGGGGGGGGVVDQAKGTRRRRGTVDENKERTMREMARVWREMETRLREINGDLNRLR